MPLHERYSCLMDDPLLETNQSLEVTLRMVALLGYVPVDFGVTSIGPASDGRKTTHNNIAFLLLQDEGKKGSAGVVKKSDMEGSGPENKRNGYVVYELRY